MEIQKRPRGRPRKAQAVEVSGIVPSSPISAVAEVPPRERKARRWRPPVVMPAFVPQLGNRPRPVKRRPILHPYQG